ncbi:uncharacterized protein [Ptychodera flava]|uniref:uncharacterized protein n=1 Tax=Ptychodera flava TaxID=63121 RepID=UPI00396A4DB7
MYRIGFANRKMKFTVALMAVLLAVGSAVNRRSGGSGSTDDGSCVFVSSEVYGNFALANRLVAFGIPCDDELTDIRSQLEGVSPSHSTQIYQARALNERIALIFTIDSSQYDTISPDSFGDKILDADDLDGCRNCTIYYYKDLKAMKKLCSDMNCPPKLDGVYWNSPMPVSYTGLAIFCYITKDGYNFYCKDFTPAELDN